MQVYHQGCGGSKIRPRASASVSKGQHRLLELSFECRKGFGNKYPARLAFWHGRRRSGAGLGGCRCRGRTIGSEFSPRLEASCLNATVQCWLGLSSDSTNPLFFNWCCAEGNIVLSSQWRLHTQLPRPNRRRRDLHISSSWQQYMLRKASFLLSSPSDL